MGIDYGSRRIGLAVSDPQGDFASPLSVIERRGNDDQQVRAILAVAAEYEVEAFVVGLPLNMDDTEGPQAKRTRTFGARLERASGKPVYLADERLSSVGADDHLAAAQLSRRKHKARRDAVAAQIILQGFLDSREDRSAS